MKPVFKKEFPVCKHCGTVGHVIDKCFKIHGYPPGYKVKPKQQSLANHVVSDNDSSVASPFTFTESQYQQLLAILSSHDSIPSQHTVNAVSSTSHVGIDCFCSHFSSVFSTTCHTPPNIDSYGWIIDSGATDHMVPSISFFCTCTPVFNTSVNLPNG